MTITKHTKEPWVLSLQDEAYLMFVSAEYNPLKQILIAKENPDQETVSNYKRIVACVNALEGLSNDALEGGWNFKEMSAYAKKLEDENAKLIAALKHYQHEELDSVIKRGGFMEITSAMKCQEILNYAQPKTDLEIALYEKFKTLVGDLYDNGIDPEDVEFSVKGVF